ncbi:hypothetical protein EHEL_090780 [Encephalitozoon hellem ATCC 50504]|uniref:Elongation factor n=1 Tax=Encephalitozoon hellem TaxID=27973 RepID=A0A9Q9FA90_ENCHE|nr:uncharacterized protein EHEL_090780 [Encephalitozoon hellem ATCC 50504]AFM98973.1 hypothetical protein EHEL_090780 [Encephalitozoon hellem ATCC 50504]UTX43987.1 elongation factor [Encephalitozoon hellem]|eukprot:XP_003887954.1 hypothetical protein EHEL_090780 [Encephalitozoon hellem ATCC 50504]
MKEDETDVEIIEHCTEALGSHESLYKKKTPLANVEEKDLHYFDFIAQNEWRKAVAGFFGFGGAGKTSLIRLLGSRSVIKGAGPCLSTETRYEMERGCTVHVHPTVAFLQRENGASCIITLLDTPGHSDLAPEALRILRCIDIAIIVLDICCDLSLQHELIFDAVNSSGKPSIVVLNKTDLVGKESKSLAERKIEHLRGVVEARVHPRAWFISSFKCGMFSRMNGDVFEPCREPESGLNELIEEMLSTKLAEHKRDDEERLEGFLWAGETMLSSLVPRADVNVGSTAKISGANLVAERLYIPFPGCLVETRAAKANVGVLVKFQETLLQRIASLDTRRAPVPTIKKVLEEEKLVCASSGFLEMGDPVVRVQIDLRDEEGFLSEAWKLELIYRGLKIDKKNLYGNGELFMDAVLYDLRNVLNVEFQVLSVSANLKEAFRGSFVEEVETEEGLITVKGGKPADADQDCKQSEDIEGWILSEGLLIGEPFFHSYLSISPKPLELDSECLRKVKSSVARHAAILEPLYLVEVVYAPEAEDLVNEIITSSFGEVIRQGTFPFSILRSVLCYIPVAESFGFETDLRIYSCSRADCTKIPFYWSIVADRSRESSLVKFMRKIKRSVPKSN